MSLLAFLLDDLARPTIYGQHFGLRLLDDVLIPSEYNPHLRSPFDFRSYQRPTRSVVVPNSGMSHISNNKDGFKVKLNVQRFKPVEVTVKVVDDYIVVEGKHEERSDEHGFVSRQFTRRYKIPETVDPKQITSSLSSDGVLSVGTTKKVTNEKSKEISIPIIQTNNPDIEVSVEEDKMETN